MTDEQTTNAGDGPVERSVGRPVEQRADLAAKMRQARALHDLVLTLGLRPGSERFANDVSRETAIMDAEIAALLRELPAQVPNEHGHLLTTGALWGMYIEDGEPPNVANNRIPTAPQD